VICFIAGLRVHNFSHIPLAFCFMGLVAFVFASLGMAIGSILEDMQGFQLVMNFLVMPIFFLSGALFPLTNLPFVLKLVTRMDPLTYGVDALRGTLTALNHFSLGFDAMMLGLLAAVFVTIGAYLFSRIQI
jgi:ABC-2 type transport system permease protein